MLLPFFCPGIEVTYYTHIGNPVGVASKVKKKKLLFYNL
jgi:hypothetical protein